MASKDKTILMEQEDERAAVLNYLKENKMLLISVDPGYDGFKIYINNRQFLSKSLVVEIGKSDDFEDIKLSTIGDGSFVQMRDFNSGKILQYATGKNAQEDLINEAVDISDFRPLHSEHLSIVPLFVRYGVIQKSQTRLIFLLKI